MPEDSAIDEDQMTAEELISQADAQECVEVDKYQQEQD